MFLEVIILQKGRYKKLSYEDKFDRKYACWTFNHKGWYQYKRSNRRTARRAEKAEAKSDIIEYFFQDKIA